MACSDPVAILTTLVDREVMFRCYTDMSRTQTRGILKHVKGMTFKIVNGRDSYDIVTFCAMNCHIEADEIALDLRKGQSYI